MLVKRWLPLVCVATMAWAAPVLAQDAPPGSDPPPPPAAPQAPPPASQPAATVAEDPEPEPPPVKKKKEAAPSYAAPSAPVEPEVAPEEPDVAPPDASVAPGGGGANQAGSSEPAPAASVQASGGEKKSVYELDPPIGLLTRRYRATFRMLFGLGGSLTAERDVNEEVTTPLDGATLPGFWGWQAEYMFVSKYFLVGPIFGMNKTSFSEETNPFWVVDMGFSLKFRVPITLFYRDFMEVIFGASGGLSFAAPNKEDLAGFSLKEEEEASAFFGASVFPSLAVQVNPFRWLGVYAELGWHYHVNQFDLDDGDTVHTAGLVYDYSGFTFNTGLSFLY